MTAEGTGSIVGLISERYGALSVSHRRLADYILANPHQAALATLERMAASSGVSIATANRLATRLGLSGYPELKRLMRAELEDALRPVEATTEAIRRHGLSSAAPWTRSIEADVQHIYGIRAVGGDAGFAKSSALLASARRVLVAGLGSSAFFAQYATFNLATLRDAVTAITDSSGIEGALRQTLGAGPKDAALFLSFARYSEHSLRIAEQLHKAGVPLVCITDAEDAPATAYATATILVERQPGFVLVGGGAGVIAAIEALLHGTASAIGIELIEQRAAQLTTALGDTILPPTGLG